MRLSGHHENHDGHEASGSSEVSVTSSGVYFTQARVDATLSTPATFSAAGALPSFTRIFPKIIPTNAILSTLRYVWLQTGKTPPMFPPGNLEHGNLDRHPGASQELRVAHVDPSCIRLSAELTCSSWRQRLSFDFRTVRSSPSAPVTFLFHTYHLKRSIVQNTVILYHYVDYHVAFSLRQHRLTPRILDDTLGVYPGETFPCLQRRASILDVPGMSLDV